MNGKNRKDIRIGLQVFVIEKYNQRSGKLTKGVVKDILTNAQQHPLGIKVRLTSGRIGRVSKIITKE